MAILSALVLNGPHKARSLTDEAEIVAALREPQLAWLHMQADDPGTRPWIEANLGFLDAVSLTALLQGETRPRAETLDAGALVILRGVNTNPGADPEDMVSIRMWIDEHRIVTLSRRPLASIAALRAEILAARGPERAGAFLCRLIELINMRLETVLRDLEDRVDALESDVLGEPNQVLRQGITDARQDVILFRRFVAPQRDALTYLHRRQVPPFLTKGDMRRLGEGLNRTVRVVEELDEFRDRLAVIRDELTHLLSDRVSRNLYLLSVISLIFLPLGFLTGLLGINVGGIPGGSDPVGFWVVCVVCAAVVGLVLALLRRIRWI